MSSWFLPRYANLMSSFTQSPVIDAIIRFAPESLDLTIESHLKQATLAADQIRAEYPALADLNRLESTLTAEKERWPLLLHLAVKLAKSKQILAGIHEPVHISVVFAVYKEHIRIRTKEAHPLGENFLLRKINQLNWLMADFPHFSWDMLVVDDGCPEGSGRIAQEILARDYDGDNVRVLFLEEAIAQGLPVTRPMTSTNDSRKGGSIEYGMWVAAQQRRPNHIVLFTDADLSTHLGQTGLLVGPIMNEDADAAIGSRREPESIVVKTGTRNLRGKLFIYLWKRVITNLPDIVDTQAGFKAFRAEVVREIVEDMLEKQFAFDIELLIKTQLRRPGRIVKVPIAWIDSDALSTTTDLQPYLNMLKSMVAMYRRYLPPNPRSNSFAAFIEGLDEDQWQTLVAHVPEPIASREPYTFSDFDAVTVEDFRAILQNHAGASSR